MLFAHGALFLLRTPLSQVLPWSPTNQVFDSVWLTVLSFEALLFTIAIAFILLAMAKERTELRHKTAALVDPLTGIANRRAFLEEVDCAEQAPGGGSAARPRCCSPISITSSRSTTASATPSATACCRFSPTAASAKLGPYDLIGRLGGEEFAIVLYDAGREKALAIAERIRLAFETAAAEVDGRRSAARSASAWSIAETNLFDIPALLAQADEALYCAKERGRNRVEVASLQLVLDRAREPAAPPSARAAPAAAPARPAPHRGFFRRLTSGGGFDLFLHSHQLAVSFSIADLSVAISPGGGEIAV